MTDQTCDVAVVGSGAAGSTLAFMLARRGHRVVVLERGARCDPRTFEHNEYASMPRLYKAHPQGGNAMSDDVSIGVVDSQFRVHGFDNLSIVDASVMPENLWANCQATTMALAHVASDFVAASL